MRPTWPPICNPPFRLKDHPGSHSVMSAPPPNPPNPASSTSSQSGRSQVRPAAPTAPLSPSVPSRGTPASPGAPGLGTGSTGSVRTRYESRSASASRSVGESPPPATGPAAGTTSATSSHRQGDSSRLFSTTSARTSLRNTALPASTLTSTPSAINVLGQDPETQLKTPSGEKIINATHILVEHIHGGTVNTHVFAANGEKPAPLHDAIIGRSSCPTGPPLSTTRIACDGTAIKEGDNTNVIEAVRSSHQETIKAFEDLHKQGTAEVTLAATLAIDRQLKEAIEPQFQHLAQLIERHGTMPPPTSTSLESATGPDGGIPRSQVRSGAPSRGIHGDGSSPSPVVTTLHSRAPPRSPSSSTAANGGEGTSRAGSDNVRSIDQGTRRSTGMDPSGSLVTSSPSSPGASEQDQDEPGTILDRLSQIEAMLSDLHKASFKGEFPDDPNQVLGAIDPHATPRMEALRAEMLGGPDHFLETSNKLDSLVKALEDMPKKYGELFKGREDRYPLDRAFVNKFLAFSMMLVLQARHIKKNLGSLVNAINGMDENRSEGKANNDLAFTITKGLESVENQIKELYRVIDIPSIDALQGMADTRDKALNQGIDTIASMNQSTQKSIDGLQTTFLQLHSNLTEFMNKISQSSSASTITCSCSCSKACPSAGTATDATPLDSSTEDNAAVDASPETSGEKELPTAPPQKETPRQRQERHLRERAEAEAKRAAAESATTTVSTDPTSSGPGAGTAVQGGGQFSSGAGPATEATTATPTADPGAGSSKASSSPSLPSSSSPSGAPAGISVPCSLASCPELQSSLQGLSEMIVKMSELMQDVGSTIRGGQNTLYTTLLQQSEKIFHAIKPPSTPETEAEAAIRKKKEEDEAREKELREKEEKEAAEAAEKLKAEAKQQRQDERMAGLQQISLIWEKVDTFTSEASQQGERVEAVLSSVTEQNDGLLSQMIGLQTSLTGVDAAMATAAKASQAEKIEKDVEAMVTQQSTQHEAVMEQVKEILSTANDVYDAVEECKKLSEGHATQQAAMMAILEEYKKLRTDIAATATAASYEKSAAEGDRQSGPTTETPSELMAAGGPTVGNGNAAAQGEDRSGSDDNDDIQSKSQQSTGARRPLPPLPGHTRALELLRLIEAYLRDHVTSTVGPDAPGSTTTTPSLAVDPVLDRARSSTEGTVEAAEGASIQDPRKDVGAERRPTGGILVPPTTNTGGLTSDLEAPSTTASTSEDLLHERFVAEQADFARRYCAWSKSREEAATMPVSAVPEDTGSSSSSSVPRVVPAAAATPSAEDAPKVSRETLESIRQLLPLEDYERKAALLAEAKQGNEQLAQSMAEKDALVKGRDESIKQLEEQRSKIEKEYQDYKREAAELLSTAEYKLAEEKRRCEEAVAKQKKKTRAAKELIQQYVRAGLGIVSPEPETSTTSGTESGPSLSPPARGPLPVAQLMKEASEQLSQTMEELKEQRSILQREIAELQEEKARLLTSNAQLERCPCIHHQLCQHPLPLAVPGDKAAPAAEAAVSEANKETEVKEEGGSDDDGAPASSLSLALTKHQPTLIACIGVEREGLRQMLLEHATPLTEELLSRAVLDGSDATERQWAFHCAFRIGAQLEVQSKPFGFM
ncbi:hypothetical protein BGZ73_007461 [Actinomortierella ambigua]|nr:hypothetical protein BGZ73_007461 [Actinomortierella ambigua]